MNPDLIRLIARLLEIADETRQRPSDPPASHRARLVSPRPDAGGVGHVALLGYN
jgi:hypothetical protein